MKKNDSLLIRCEPADRSLIRWAAANLKLEQSEVIRQGFRIGIPLLVKRMSRLTPTDSQAVAVRKSFKRAVSMADILKATEEAH